MKTIQRTEACVLRRRGYSFLQLSDRLGISKSTASVWTRNIEMSQLGKERLHQHRLKSSEYGNEILRNRKLRRLEIADAEAQKRTEKVTPDPVTRMVILSMVYECEGSKGDRSIRFTNSDPQMVQLFLSTFRSSFSIKEKKIKIRVHIHDYHQDGKIKAFWSSITGVPLEQFYPSFQKVSNHTYKKAGYKGCIHIFYNDAHVTRVIRGFAKKVIKLYI